MASSTQTSSVGPPEIHDWMKSFELLTTALVGFEAVSPGAFWIIWASSKGLLEPIVGPVLIFSLLVSAWTYLDVSPVMKTLLTAVPRWKWKLHTRDLGQPWARSSPYCMVSFCRVYPDVASDHRSTRRNIHDPRRDGQATGLAACHRGTVPLRTSPNL